MSPTGILVLVEGALASSTKNVFTRVTLYWARLYSNMTNQIAIWRERERDLCPKSQLQSVYIKPPSSSCRFYRSQQLLRLFLNYFSTIHLSEHCWAATTVLSFIIILKRSRRSILTKMSYTGRDWLCGACHHVNFRRRDACQRCGYPKIGGPDQEYSSSNCGSNRNSGEALPGDWFCSAENCGAHNYASRSKCFRCDTLKDDNGVSDHGYGLGSCSSLHPPPGWKPGDWMCSSCGAHNYACREVCFKCRTSNYYVEKSSVGRAN